MQTMTKLPVSMPIGNRQLPERLIVAAHQSIDLGDLETASRLLGLVEDLVKDKVTRSGPPARRLMESVVAAHMRIWDLRNQDHAAIAPAYGVRTAPSVSGTPHESDSLPVIHDRWAFWNRQDADSLLATEYPSGQYQQ